MQQDSTHFTVKTERFEGPFDALLTMIEKKKLHISEISLAEIADDYISYVREHEFILKEVAVFIQTAATLMLIKSRHLLPQFFVTDEEEEDISSLQNRIQVYAIFKKQMEVVENMFGLNRAFKRRYKKNAQVIFRPDSRITQEEMRLQIEGVFKTVEPETFVPRTQVSTQKSLKEVIEDIATRIKRFVQVNFKELVAQSDKREQAVSFLAILELFKQGDIDLSQDGQFASIEITNTKKQVG